MRTSNSSLLEIRLASSFCESHPWSRQKTWCIPILRHALTDLWIFWRNWSSKLQENKNARKTQLLHKFKMPNIRTQRCEVFCLSENYLFFKIYVTSEGGRFSQCAILSTALHCSLPSNLSSLPIVSLPELGELPQVGFKCQAVESQSPWYNINGLTSKIMNCTNQDILLVFFVCFSSYALFC